MKVEEHMAHANPKKPSQEHSGKEDLSDLQTCGWVAGVGDLHIGQMYSECKGSLKSCELGMTGRTQIEALVAKGGIELDHKPSSKRSALRRHCEFWDADQVSFFKSHM